MEVYRLERKQLPLVRHRTQKPSLSMAHHISQRVSGVSSDANGCLSDIAAAGRPIHLDGFYG